MPEMRQEQRRPETHTHMQPKGRQNNDEEQNTKTGKGHVRQIHSATNKKGNNQITLPLPRRKGIMVKQHTPGKQSNRGTKKDRMDELPYGNVVKQMDAGTKPTTTSQRIKEIGQQMDGGDDKTNLESTMGGVDTKMQTYPQTNRNEKGGNRSGGRNQRATPKRSTNKNALTPSMPLEQGTLQNPRRHTRGKQQGGRQLGRYGK